MKQAELVPQGPVEILAPQDKRLSPLETILAAAQDPKADPDRVKAFLDLYRDMQAIEAKRLFTEAMNRLKPRIPPIVKNRKITVKGTVRSHYAALEDIDKVLAPLMADEGFTASYTTQQCDKGVNVIMTLRHVAGHEETSEFALPIDKSEYRSDPQNYATSVTYGRRYAKCNAFDIVPVDMDTDGAGGFINDEQKAFIRAQFVACKMDDGAKAKFLEYMKAATLDEIPANAYNMAKTALANRLRKVQSQ